MDELAQQIQGEVDKNYAAAKERLAHGLAVGRAHAWQAVSPVLDPIITTGEELVTEAEKGYKKYHVVILKTTKDAIEFAEEYPNSAAAIGVSSAAMLLPGTRRMLYRRTFGMFRTNESIFRNAERKSAWLKEGLETQTKEVEKLRERVKLAEEELLRGQSKLAAAGAQLRQLASQSRRYQVQARELASDLAGLPIHKDMAGLREQVRDSYSVVNRQTKELDRQLRSVANLVSI